MTLPVGLLRTRPRNLAPSRPALTIVRGAPGAGKSTYVSQQAGADDVVICFDTIAARMFGVRRPKLSPTAVAQVLIERNTQARALAQSDARAAWLVLTAGDLGDALWWWYHLGGRIVTVATPLPECERRILADPERVRVAADNIRGAREWWFQNEGLPPGLHVTAERSGG